LPVGDGQGAEAHGGGQRKLTASHIAATIWDSLEPDEQGPARLKWLNPSETETESVEIPDGEAKALGASHMFHPEGAEFVQGKTVHQVDYSGVGQAALAALFAGLEIRGEVELPVNNAACNEWRQIVQERLSVAQTRFDELASTRTADQSVRDGIVSLLLQWFIHGRDAPKATD